MHPMLNIAVKAARSAGNIIARHVNRIDSLSIQTEFQWYLTGRLHVIAISELVKREIGEGALLAAQVGIAGSTTLGRGAVLGGQEGTVGATGHGHAHPRRAGAHRNRGHRRVTRYRRREVFAETRNLRCAVQYTLHRSARR